MLALAVTILAAVYLFGPDLFWRFILGFVVPRRNIQQSRSEEVARAVLIAVLPLAFVVAWISAWGIVDWRGSSSDIQCFFNGISSEKFFAESPQRFYRSLSVVASINWAICWRLYGVILALSFSFNWLILHYGRVRHSRFMQSHPNLRRALAAVVLPRVSEWHLLFSSFALPDADTAISADVLTKSNTLYRGTLEPPLLAGDGSLAGLLLSEPKRFRRTEFTAARVADRNACSDDFWTDIPSKTFLLLASDISNINLRHFGVEPGDVELLQEISRLLDKANLSLTTKRDPSPS